MVIDEVVTDGTDVLLGIRDPGSGQVGYVFQQEFDVTYFQHAGVWFE